MNSNMSVRMCREGGVMGIIGIVRFVGDSLDSIFLILMNYEYMICK